jgi:predicted SAM-dependent methyltransferase
MQVGTRKLHIGAKKVHEGWETLNITPFNGIDHVMDAKALGAFADNTFNVLYASHVLEHFDYKDEVLAVLKEWHRVLAPGGELLVSVPDLDVVCSLIIQRDRFSANERLQLMRMLFGGHCDQYDYHLTGFNSEILVGFLIQAGFSKVFKTRNFGLFKDTSTLCFKGELISLNIVAVKRGLAFKSLTV